MRGGDESLDALRGAIDGPAELPPPDLFADDPRDDPQNEEIDNMAMPEEEVEEDEIATEFEIDFSPLGIPDDLAHWTTDIQNNSKTLAIYIIEELERRNEVPEGVTYWGIRNYIDRCAYKWAKQQYSEQKKETK